MDDNIETRVQALLARRRAMNASGQAGEDVHQIRAAFAAALSNRTCDQGCNGCEECTDYEDGNAD